MENSHLGVDLTPYSVHKLIPDPIFSNYTKENLHFPIGAVQKGLKPHTQKGIKRIMKKNFSKRQKIKADKNYVKPLNPKCPEQICMKSLRTVFRQKMEQNHMQNQAATMSKKQKWAKRKAHQKQRRKQLRQLVKQHGPQLRIKFGTRMQGIKNLPKVSRKQIKEALGLTTNTIETQIPAVEKPNKIIVE